MIVRIVPLIFLIIGCMFIYKIAKKAWQRAKVEATVEKAETIDDNYSTIEKLDVKKIKDKSKKIQEAKEI